MPRRGVQPQGLFSKRLYIDGKDHLLGKLASYVAKALLQGNRVVVFNCDKINIAGSFYRNKIKYLSFLRKRCNVNPARGPYHYRAPRCIFRKCVRGMIPHKTTRGDRALKRLRTFEDIPARYTKQKTFVVPLAMRVLSLQLGRKYCTIDRLSHEVGWKYKHVIEDYAKRRVKREELNAKKLSVKRKLTRKAKKVAKKALEPYNEIIRQYGYHA
ncbi:large ribosomal subunit protein uL13-like [Planococcus citri]|uniref:large ribosomal subunit protein uL13-like n=1 Tax=Planococcus citri TaxID=170843 RepID=UPI0031FA42D9